MATATRKRRKQAGPRDGVKVRGFFRLKIVDDDGTVRGDSGYRLNQIVDNGYKSFLAGALGKGAGSSQIGFIALGTGTAPATGATSLPNEISGSTQRTAVTYTLTGTKTAQFTATFNSSSSFLAASSSLANIGLFANSSDTSLFAGNTYTASACNTNQNVNATYSINFS